MTTETKMKVLASYLNEDVEEIEEGYNGSFECESQEYLVCTYEEAQEKAEEYILDSLWAFNPSFLAGFSVIKDYQAALEVFKAIQANDRYEDNNETIKELIKDFDNFVESAILADGIGHFLASYDGEEIEHEYDGVTYHIYRVN